MEEDKKKRKNKKKKNKQNKTAETSLDGAGEHDTSDQNQVSQTDQKSTGEVHEIRDDHNDVLLTRDAGNQLRHVAIGPEVSTLAEAEKDCWLEREASLEEKIKQLQEERDADIQKEVILEEKIQQLQKEKDASLAEEANLLEKIKQLQGEKAAYSVKEAGLECQISQLEKERSTYTLKESRLEEEIARLQNEKEAHMQKESQFEMKINHLVYDAAALSSEKVSLEEKAKQMEREIYSWVQKENTHKEAVAILNVDNSRLHAQVLQLEQSRNSLLEENRHLKETVSGLQSQILNLEANAALSHSSVEGKMQTVENGDVGLEIEAAHMLIEKLITENAELVEKVNELYVELNRTSLQKEISSDEGTPGTAESAVVADNSSDFLDLKVEADEGQTFVPTANLIHETGAKMLVSGENGQSENDVNSDGRNYGYMGATNAGGYLNSSDSGEIVQIPLDENERLLTDLEAGNNGESTGVPISDAPLIGAPFRIMSFFARYVSGADLVEKN